MFIVIEGTDASGKSTLVDAIVQHLKSQGRAPNEYHKGKPEELTRDWVLTNYVTDMERYNFQEVDAVADRWHWGEITYAPHKRPHTNIDGYGLLGESGWRWTEMFLTARGAAQYWLYQPLDILVRRLNSRGDDFVQAHELEMILELYNKAAARTQSLAAKIMPFAEQSVGDLAETLVRDADYHAQRAAHLAAFPEYIGSIRPDALLIGDKRNGPPSRTLLPFMPVNSNSGEYLISALPEELWRRVGIINSGDIYGARLLELYEALGRPRIIALGRFAEREVRSSGLYVNNYTALPHPQYVRRFHHHDHAEYGLAIQNFAFDLNHERYDKWVLP